MPRGRLLRRIAANGTRVTCVIGGPGYGKTTLVREWAAGTVGSVAWVGVAGRLASEPASFWEAVSGAVAGAGGPVGTRRAGRVRRDPTGVVELFGDVEPDLALPELTIVLDDYHRVRNGAVHEGLTWLVERLPGPVHLVIIGRSDPPLPLVRWWLVGWLGQIRRRELELSSDEVRTLLRRAAGAHLNGSLDPLVERVGRWPLGVHLAALALAGERDPVAAARSFPDGPRGDLAEHLLAGIEGAGSPGKRAFLLRTSVLEQLTADACRALTRCDAVEPLLADLSCQGVVRRHGDAAGETYRYPRIYAEALRTGLASAGQEAFRRAHRDAAAYFDATDRPWSALHHLFAAGDLGPAYRLLVDRWTELTGGAAASARRPWLEGLPTSVFELDASGALHYAEAAGGNGQIEDALTLLYRLPGIWQWREPAFRVKVSWSMAISHARLGELELVRGWLAAIRKEGPESLPQGLSAAHWPEIPLTAAIEDDWGLAEDEWGWGRRHGLDRVWGPSGRTSIDGVLEAQRGFVAKAAPLLNEGAERIGKPGQVPLAARAHLLRASAIVALERGDFDEAMRLVDEVRWSCGAQDARSVERVATDALAAEIARRDGEPQRALSLVSRALRQNKAASLAPGLRSVLSEVAVRAAFDLDDYPTLAGAAEHVQPATPRVLATARAFLVQREPHRARTVLHGQQTLPALGRCDPARAIDALLLLARAAGSAAESDEALTRAIELAGATGLIGSLVAGAPSFERLEALGGRLLGEQLRPFRRQRSTTTPGRLTEPLSMREREVLGYLPTELSNYELAAELYVSLNTVKTHLKTIYRKLGVRGRSDAVGRARELGLLPPRPASTPSIRRPSPWR